MSRWRLSSLPLLPLLLVAVLAGASAPAAAQVRESAPSVMFGAGWYDFDQTGKARAKDAAAFELEYHSNARYWGYIEPFSGVMVTTDKAVYGFAGFGVELQLFDNIFVTPNAAVGVYDDGNGKKLGATVEFRTGLNLDYRFENGMRLGFAGHHISNAGIGDRNPGVNIVEFTYSIPIDRF